MIMDTFSFNNHSLLRFHETLKDAVDQTVCWRLGATEFGPSICETNQLEVVDVDTRSKSSTAERDCSRRRQRRRL
jgi:hypothetical protein